MDETGEDNQMYRNRRDRVFGIARGGCDRFAYGFDDWRSLI